MPTLRSLALLHRTAHRTPLARSSGRAFAISTKWRPVSASPEPISSGAAPGSSDAPSSAGAPPAAAPAPATATAPPSDTSAARATPSTPPANESVPLRTQLQTALKESMKSRDSARSTVIRSVLADVVNLEKASKLPLPSGAGDGEVLKALMQGISRREDALTQYLSASRPDLQAPLEAELSVLRSLLPPQLSPPELDRRLALALSHLRAQGQKKINVRLLVDTFWEMTGTGRGEVEGRRVSERARGFLEEERERQWTAEGKGKGEGR